MSEYYRVVVRIRKLEGFDNVFEEKEFTPVYAANAEDAATSVVVQKKVKKEQILSVSSEQMY